MKKNDWIEYFKTIHGRAPSKHEITEAIINGHFEEEKEKQTISSPYIFVLIFLVSFIVGCGIFAVISTENSENNSVLSSQDSGIEIINDDSGYGNSSEQVKSDLVDIYSVMEGDYSTLEGKWRNNTNTEWGEFRIDEDGVFYFSGSKDGTLVKDFQATEDGTLVGRTAIGGDFVTIMPVGTGVQGGKNNDNSKDRIAIGDKLERFNDPQVYYRVDE